MRAGRRYHRHIAAVPAAFAGRARADLGCGIARRVCGADRRAWCGRDGDGGDGGRRLPAQFQHAGEIAGRNEERREAAEKLYGVVLDDKFQPLQADQRVIAQAAAQAASAAQALSQATQGARQQMQGQRPGKPGPQGPPGTMASDKPQNDPPTPEADPGVPPELAKLGISSADWEKIQASLKSDVGAGEGDGEAAGAGAAQPVSDGVVGDDAVGRAGGEERGEDRGGRAEDRQPPRHVPPRDRPDSGRGGR